MASSYIHRTNSSGSGTTATISMWVKQNQTTADGGLFQFYTDSTNYVSFYSNPDLKFRTYISSSYGQGDKATKLKNRDSAAWYHYVCVFDTTNGDANDRMRLWVNGVRIDAPDLNTDTDPSASYSFTPLVSGIFQLNKYGGNSTYSDHIYSHVHYCDGYAYDASTFGEFDSTSGIWKIKTGPSVSYGTNGVFLKFEDRTNLDLDSSPNAHTMTTVGTPTATYDNPSNNFATLNPLAPTSAALDLKNANTCSSGPNSNNWWQSVPSTLGASAGKWYFEFKDENAWGGTGDSTRRYGICDLDNIVQILSSAGDARFSSSTAGYAYMNASGVRHNASTITGTDSTCPTFVPGDILMCAMDLDNGKIVFWQKWNLERFSRPYFRSNRNRFSSGYINYSKLVSICRNSLWFRCCFSKLW